MRLATFLPPDPDGASPAPRAGAVADGHVTAFADELVTVLDILGDPSPARAAGSLSAGPSWALEEVTLLAPVLAPRAIFGIDPHEHPGRRRDGPGPPALPWLG